MPNYDIVKNLLQHVELLIVSDNQQSFLNFITATCGKSIRSGLTLACNILALVPTHSQELASINIHNIKRVLINQGEPEYRFSFGQIIQNVFRTSGGSESGLLIKLRILKYLKNRPGGYSKLSELINILVDFGYQTPVIIDAVNDLMTTNSQLIRSSIFDRYSNEVNTFQEDIASSVITLTSIGEGYLQNLIYDMDYLQEIMLDTYLDLANFPISFEYQILLDKFQILVIFLNELHEVDNREMEKFLNEKDINSYFEVFGNRLISLDIIQQAYSNRVIAFEGRK